MCYGIAVGDGIDRRVLILLCVGRYSVPPLEAFRIMGSSPLSGWTGIGGVEGGESFWG